MPAQLVDVMLHEDATVPAAVAHARRAIVAGIECIERAFRDGGRLFYVGAGTSGRLGVLDATECPPTFGTPPGMVQGIIAGGAAALVRSVEGAEDDVGAGARRHGSARGRGQPMSSSASRPAGPRRSSAPHWGARRTSVLPGCW